MTIIQGTNRPITILFVDDVDVITDFHAYLYDTSGNELKHWEYDTVTLEDNAIKLELTQSETIAFPTGLCSLELKWLDKDGLTDFSEIITCRVMYRKDKHILGEEDDDE